MCTHVHGDGVHCVLIHLHDYVFLHNIMVVCILSSLILPGTGAWLIFAYSGKFSLVQNFTELLPSLSEENFMVFSFAPAL